MTTSVAVKWLARLLRIHEVLSGGDRVCAHFHRDEFPETAHGHFLHNTQKVNCAF